MTPGVGPRVDTLRTRLRIAASNERNPKARLGLDFAAACAKQDRPEYRPTGEL